MGEGARSMSGCAERFDERRELQREQKLAADRAEYRRGIVKGVYDNHRIGDRRKVYPMSVDLFPDRYCHGGEVFDTVCITYSDWTWRRYEVLAPE